MSIKRNYTISILKDVSRLDEVCRLAYETLLEAGDVAPQEEGLLKTFPHLDNIPETTILIAEQEGKVVGTISITVDSNCGLNTDKWFKMETDEIRKKIKPSVLCSSWRIATDKSFRNNQSLVLDLISSTFEILLKLDCEICLFIFNSRHISAYQKIIGAELITTKKISLANGDEIQIALMKMDTKKGWGIFNRSRT